MILARVVDLPLPVVPVIKINPFRRVVRLITDGGKPRESIDGISYGKGSSFLKVLYKLVGNETMRKGLHKYFDDHQWKNTTLPDFVNSIKWKKKYFIILRNRENLQI